MFHFKDDSLRRNKQLDKVPVWISEENLPRAIGPLLLRLKLYTGFGQVFLPDCDVVHLQRKMIAPAAGKHFVSPIADEVQLLRAAQALEGPKPNG